jgi:hypothetical protein
MPTMTAPIPLFYNQSFNVATPNGASIASIAIHGDRQRPWQST